MSRGLVTGYTDGSFKPNGQVTRAEFFALINRSFGFTEKESVKFRDLAEGSWAYDEVSKAVKAGYVSGYANGSVGASNPISRQEAAVIVARLLDLKGSEAGTAFSDADSFASWADPAIRAVSASNIMRGSSGKFSPGVLITRGEAVVTLDRANLAHAAEQANRKYNAAGIYGPESGKETLKGSVAVNAPGVTLRNMVIEGDLVLGEGIGTGDAFLDGVEVKGRVLVQGGGEHSIHFNDSVLVDVIIDKASGFGTVRIVSEGTTTVAMVLVNSPAVIQESGSTAAGFGNVNVSSSLPAGSKVTLQGSFDTLNVSAKQIQVDLPEGTVKKFNAASTASDTVLNLGFGTTVNSLVLDAIVKVLGRGTIVAAVMNTGGSTFQTPPQTSSGSGSPTAPTTPAPVTPPPSVPSNPTTPSVPAADTAALGSAIAAAEELLGTHKAGEANGSVPQAAHDAYRSAIAAAKQVKDSSASTQVQVNAAVDALASASTAFRGEVIIVDKASLNSTIEAARERLSAHDIGEANGNVAEEAHVAYESAIFAANEVFGNAAATQVQVNTAVAALNSASDVFGAAVIVVDTTALNAAIAEASQLLAAHNIGEANGNVSQETHDALAAVIAGATTIANAQDRTNGQVQEALDNLALAETLFKGEGSIVVVNTEALSFSVFIARNDLIVHPVGQANGHVPEAAYAAFEQAVNAAAAVVEDPSTTQKQVQAALDMLATASSAFKGQFVVVTVSELAAAINSANGEAELYPVGTGNGNVPQSAADALASAIEAAAAVASSPNSTQTQVDGAVVSLSTAVEAFKKSVIVKVSIQADSSLSSTLPMLKIDDLPAGINQIEVYDGTTLVGSAQANGPKASVVVDYLAPGTHSLSVQVTNAEAAGAIASNVVTHESVATILPQDQISAGAMHGVALSAAGAVYTWGNNNSGQIGDGTTTAHPAIYNVPGMPAGIVAIEAGFDHTMILTQDGKVWKWGRGAGQTPAPVGGLDHIVAIGSEGGTLAVFLKSDGTVWYGEAYQQPVNMGLTDIKAVVGTYASAYALKTDGTVLAWGSYNDNGQLGNGTTTGSSVPVQVLGLPNNIKEIRGGNQHGVALTADGDVYAWGFNDMGQVGNGTKMNSLTAVKVEGLPKIQLIGIGDYNTFAKSVDGKMYAWGYGNDGQLGLGNMNRDTLVPQEINYDLSNVLAISGGGSNTTFALLADGQVMSWGSPSYGMLGNGQNGGSYRTSPGSFIPDMNLLD